MTCIAILFANYGPYHLDRLRSFHQHCSRIGWEVVGIELAREEVEHAWKTSVEGLPFTVVSVVENQQPDQVKFHHLLQRLYAVLSQVKPQILVIAGYARPAMLAALLWSYWNQKPAVLFSATKQDDAPRSWWRETVKKWIRTYALTGS